jgi:hypothetical protein
MIYVPNFIRIGSTIQTLIGGNTYRHTDSNVILYTYFYFFKIRKVEKWTLERTGVILWSWIS